MFSSYYLPRWKEFFARLNRALDSGTTFDRAPFAADMCQWEQDWSHQHDRFSTTPQGDPVATAARLYQKYRGDISQTTHD
jgi:alpha-N-acetylglucosaminidase